MLRKNIFAFAATIMLALCSCTVTDYGETKTKAEFEDLIAQAEQVTGVMDTANVDVEVVATLNDAELLRQIGKFNGNVDDYDPTIQEQLIAFTIINGFTYTSAMAQFSSVVPAENIQYYANSVPEFTVMIDYSGNQTVSDMDVAFTIQATYKWDAHGNIIYVDENQTSTISAQGQSMVTAANTKLTGSYTYK